MSEGVGKGEGKGEGDLLARVARMVNRTILSGV